MTDDTQESPADILRAWAIRTKGRCYGADAIAEADAALAVLEQLRYAREVADFTAQRGVRMAKLASRYRRKNNAVRAALEGFVCPQGSTLAERVGMLRDQCHRLALDVSTCDGVIDGLRERLLEDQHHEPYATFTPEGLLTHYECSTCGAEARFAPDVAHFADCAWAADMKLCGNPQKMREDVKP